MINYTQQEYERNVAIVKGAPKGATHFDDGGNYESPFTWYRYTKSGYEVWMWEDKEWRMMPNDCIECPADIRSLSDIKALIAMHQRQWISVEDRLPEIGQPVGVCRVGAYRHIGCIRFQSESIHSGKRFWHGSNACFYAEPTHWMPLPQPPQEGE